jgi:hypothetical protein
VPKEFNTAGSHVLGTTPTATITPASSAALFLTNLKLLDLDLVVGWPGISLDTFAAAGAAGAQGQKRRIQCVEWALFHLFALWDPEETANVGSRHQEPVLCPPRLFTTQITDVNLPPRN